MVADLKHNRVEKLVASKTALFVLQTCQDHVNIETKGCNVVFEFSLCLKMTQSVFVLSAYNTINRF